MKNSFVLNSKIKESYEKGELQIALEIFLWSFFPIVTILSLSIIPSLTSLAWSTAFSSVFFVVLVTIKKQWGYIKNILLWKYALGITLLNGVLYYILYFIGLQYTSAGNASIIVLLEVLTTYIFFNVILQEHITKEYILGSVLMLLGAFIVLAPNFTAFNIGDFFILGTVFLTPLGNLFQKKARAIAPAVVVLSLRSTLSTPILFIIALWFQQDIFSTQVFATLPILFVIGVILLGITKVLWLEGIHRMSMTKAIALQGIGPLLTICFAWLILGDNPTIWQISSLVPLLMGILLLTDQYKFKRV
jgi:drug/metabolite transporter (DMT)-like permease